MTAKLSYLHGMAANAEVFNTANSILSIPGIVKQASFGVSGNTQIVVSSHSGLFGCGVTLTENETRYIDSTKYFTKSALAWQGTILYRLDPGLDFAPLLSLEPGLVSAGSDPNVLVVGWLLYTGNSANLDASMFYSAQTARPFRYSYFMNARNILESLSCIVTGTTAMDLWYSAKNTGYIVSLAPAGVATDIRATVQEDSKYEYWTFFTNAGTGTLYFDLEVLPHNDNEAATSLHTKLQADVGVSLTTGIISRGSSEHTLVSGSLSGPVNPGMFSVSLLESVTPVREAFRIKYHVKLPAGKKVGFAGLGVGNESFFGNKFVAD